MYKDSADLEEQELRKPPLITAAAVHDTGCASTHFFIPPVNVTLYPYGNSGASGPT